MGYRHLVESDMSWSVNHNYFPCLELELRHSCICKKTRNKTALMTRLVIFSNFFILLSPCLMGGLIASSRSFISCNRQGQSKMMDPLKGTAKSRRPQRPAVPQKTKPCQSHEICPQRSVTGSTTAPPWKWSKMAPHKSGRSFL